MGIGTGAGIVFVLACWADVFNRYSGHTAAFLRLRLRTRQNTVRGTMIKRANAARAVKLTTTMLREHGGRTSVLVDGWRRFGVVVLFGESPVILWEYMRRGGGAKFIYSSPASLPRRTLVDSSPYSVSLLNQTINNARAGL